jgi:hypothetical protein
MVTPFRRLAKRRRDSARPRAFCARAFGQRLHMAARNAGARRLKVEGNLPLTRKAFPATSSTATIVQTASCCGIAVPVRRFAASSAALLDATFHKFLSA